VALLELGFSAISSSFPLPLDSVVMSARQSPVKSDAAVVGAGLVDPAMFGPARLFKFLDLTVLVWRFERGRGGADFPVGLDCLFP
jgi:hypothetical protein